MRTLLSSLRFLLAVLCMVGAAGRANAGEGWTEQSADEALIVDVIYGGNGCLPGTARAILSPDRTRLSILFDQYIAQTEGRRILDRRSCNIAVSLRVSAGLSVGLLSVDYRGFADIAEGGAGQLSAEYFFAGSLGPTLTTDFPSGFSNNFLIGDDVPFIVWSGCGQDVIARSNTSILARKPSPNSVDSLVAVDSIDARAEIDFLLKWRYCR